MSESESKPGGEFKLEAEPTEEDSDPKKERGFNWLELSKIIAMPLVTILLGAGLNSSLNKRQERDNNVRLYADMMGRREEADAALRKDMFKSILDTFLKKGPEQQNAQYLETEVLNIELLAYNFHESLDLGPLFKHVRRELLKSAKDDPDSNMLWRLERVAIDVKERQLAVLADSGSVDPGTIDMKLAFEGDSKAISFSRSMVEYRADDQRSGPTLCLSLSSPRGETHYRQFKVTFSEARMDKREVELILAVSKPLPEHECKHSLKPEVEAANIEAKAQFWVGLFAFPMIDNTHLSLSERCSLVVTKFGDDSIELALAYFQASRASLKDKPYYDEVLHDLLRNPELSEPKEK